MTSTFVLLAPFLAVAQPAPKGDDAITLDKKGQIAVFGGDCRVKRTRAEILLDIDPNPPGTAGPMKARTRLILTPFTAKRLQVALEMTVQRHETKFGLVEVPKAKQPKDEGKPEHKDEGTLDPGLAVAYANFVRVTATPEEMFLDFGVNEDPFGAGPKVVTLERRVILTPLGSKMLLGELTRAVTGYETDFGVIELDVRKRVKQQPER
jgi:hypothetical protein